MTRLSAIKQKLRPAALVAVAGVVATMLGFLFLDALFPPSLDRFQATSVEVRANDGSLMRLFPVENGRLRSRATIDEVDPLFVRMLVAYEDKRFFRHGGVDVLAMARAIWQAARHGEIVSGASTLTMQTARLLEPRPRTIRSKMIELFRAIQLEKHFTKEEILEIYLTLAPYGGNLEGIKAASHVYFGHSPGSLTPDEAALLVVLPQAPARLRPDRNQQLAHMARAKVLNRVREDIGLSHHLARLATSAPVPLTRKAMPFIAPHLADRAWLAAGNQNLRLVTTIDPIIQKKLETLASVAAAGTHPGASTAILVVDNKSRNIVAYVGSAGYTDRARNGFVDMVQAVRSPGSALKPFIFGMAFDRNIAHPLTRIRDEARQFGTYAPTNFSDRFHGEVSAADALRKSLNVPTVALLDRLGPVHFTEALRDTGASIHLPGEEKPGLAVALGGLGISLEDLVMLYAALADDGQARPLAYLKDNMKNGPAPTAAMGERLVSTDSQKALSRILATIGAPGDRLPREFQRNPRHIAFKTGTSYGFRDALALGYDSRFTVGVWVGRPDGTPLPGHYGSGTAAPILFDAFDLLPPGAPMTIQTETATFTDLPPVLRYFDNPQVARGSHKTSPLSVAFPVTESMIEITGTNTPLALEASGGQLPLQWFVDGRPLPKHRWSRAHTLMLEGEGFYRVSVVDKNGNRASAAFMAKKPSR